MKLSRRMLLLAVLLTSGLMAASEVPELLTLSNDVSNDFELACQHVPGCSSQQVVRAATTPACGLITATSETDLRFGSSPAPAEEDTSPPLSMLRVQRK